MKQLNCFWLLDIFYDAVKWQTLYVEKLLLFDVQFHENNKWLKVISVKEKENVLHGTWNILGSSSFVLKRMKIRKENLFIIKIHK